MDLIDDPAPGANAPEYTVAEISGALKRTIEGAYGRIRVRGEVGRVMLARSGHLYFDVKDDRNVLAAVSWKGQVSRLSVMPEEGMEVVVTGNLTTFGSQSKYQLNVDDVAVAGEGALMAMLDKRRRTLAAEGLFDEARKRPIPFLPEVIGVVTSPSGAVIRDILHRLRDRFPRRVLIWPVAVQGERCAPEVARAIEGFNRFAPGGALPRPDLIIVARGGGSVEDLWGFNEEIVVRAAAASEIPLISAVGHETDTTLIDHAADRRAPTPSAAAEMAVPVRRELMAWVAEQEGRLTGALTQGLSRRGQRLADLSRALPRPEALLEGPRQRLDRAGEKLPAALGALTQRGHVRLTRAAGGLRPGVLRDRIARRRDKLDGLALRLDAGLTRPLAEQRRALDKLSVRLDPARLDSLRARRAQELTVTLARLARAGQGQVATWRRQLDGLERTRLTLGYTETLRRGYAVVRGDGAVVTTSAAAALVAALEIEFADGTLAVGPARGGPAPAPVAPAVPAPAKPRSRAKKPPGQGELF